jgi:hypothetical protein
VLTTILFALVVLIIILGVLGLTLGLYRLYRLTKERKYILKAIAGLDGRDLERRLAMIFPSEREPPSQQSAPSRRGW